MAKLKAIFILVLGISTLPSFAGGPAPWPWPWAVGCPIKWTALNHQYRLPKVSEGDQLSISLSPAEDSSEIGVYVRRSDAQGGVHSEGFAQVPKDRPNVVVYMTPQREGVNPYVIRIGVYLPYQTSGQTYACNSNRVMTVMSFESLQNQLPSGHSDYNYVLQSP